MTFDAAQVRRGDLVIATRHSRTTFVQGPGENRIEITLGVATSVSRDGRIHKWATPMFSDQADPESRRFDSQEWTWVPREKVNMKTVLARYREHIWENSSGGMIRPYESLDEVKALLRQCRTVSG